MNCREREMMSKRFCHSGTRRGVGYGRAVQDAVTPWWPRQLLRLSIPLPNALAGTPQILCTVNITSIGWNIIVFQKRCKWSAGKGSIHGAR